MINRFGSATSLIEIADPDGAWALETTPVGVDVAVLESWLLLAVTCTRSVALTSADVRVYVPRVAPPIEEKLPPVESQRRHWYL